MNKISDNVSEKLEDAMQEAIAKIDPFTELMNAGVEYEQNKEKPKRKRRTKEEMEQSSNQKDDGSILKCDTPSHIIATVEWEQDKDDDTVLPTKVEIPDSILVDEYDDETISDWLSNTVGYCHKGFSLSWPEHHETHEEFCQWEIEKAHINRKEDPNFDFRLLYTKGDKIYLVRHHKELKIKRLYALKLRTIYPRTMVGTEDKQGCQVIGMKEKDNIFINRQDAVDYFDTIKASVEIEQNEDTGKKKRKRSKVSDEDFDVEETADVYEESESEEDNE